MKGLIIQSPWIEKILNGEKTWEIRGSNTTLRGKIALIKSKSGHLLGTVDLVDAFPITLEQFQNHHSNHRIPLDRFPSLPYPKTYAWVLTNPQFFSNPIPYTHPQGAVIWVNLGDIHGI